MGVEVTLGDYSPEVLRELADKIPIALKTVGLVAEGYAKRLCPVDTGNLRNSITHAVEGNAAYIGTNVYYAPYVEMGTQHTRAQPYLRPAIINNIDTYKQIVKNTLGQ